MSAFQNGRHAPLVVAALLAALACGAAAAEHPVDAPSWRMAALSHSDMTAPTAHPADPFPQAGFRPAHGTLRAKWNEVERQMRRDAEIIEQCRISPEHCSMPARRFNDIVDAARTRSGRALIGEINRAVNLTIRPAADLQRHGVADIWTSPLATLGAGEGDCEDYAIVKLAVLRAAGMPQNDLRLLIVRDPTGHVDHAVAAAKLDGRWLILDNRRFTLMDLADTRYLPLAVLQEEVRQIAAGEAAVTGIGTAPVLM